MHVLRVAIVAAISAIPVLHIASAADLPVKAPVAPVAASYSWTGAYFGLNFGYGWGDKTVSNSPNDPLAASLFAGTLGAPGEQPLVSSYSLRQKGAVGGFEAGYNWRAGPNWVWGLEGDFSFSGVRGNASGTSVLQAPPFTLYTQSLNAAQSTDWYGTVRGRLGWLATPNLLLFGTGGVGYGRVTDSANYTFNGPAVGFSQIAGGVSFACFANTPCFTGASSATRIGWTAGGGAEWLISQSVSFKIEYQFVDLGTETVQITATPFPGFAASSFNAQFRNQIQTVRGGVNFHF